LLAYLHIVAFIWLLLTTLFWNWCYSCDDYTNVADIF